MKELFNADVFGTNPKNKVQNEKMESITANAVYFVEHSIYFADTMSILTDPLNADSRLSLETDYLYAELDSIATEQSNKDCYRALIFLKDFPKVYLSYHSYGDVVSAETFNEFINEVNKINSNADSMKDETEKLKQSFLSHEKNDKAHNATEDAAPSRIPLRTKDGTLKAANPKENADLVTLEHETKALQEAEKKTDEKIKTSQNEIKEDISLIEKKVKIESPVLEKSNFYPADYDYSGNPA
ncbi:hypothetical protein, partial [Treponema pedis]|uniref:hypothetical protein n=1 Tax=Treponema pedis TaxID=409322 RepID=UPI0031436410